MIDVIIFSIDKSNAHIDESKHATLVKTFNKLGITYELCQIVNRDKKLLGYIVDIRHESVVTRMCRICGTMAFIRVNKDGAASRVQVGGYITVIGHFKDVGAIKASTRDRQVYVPGRDSYFIYE